MERLFHHEINNNLAQLTGLSGHFNRTGLDPSSKIKYAPRRLPAAGPLQVRLSSLTRVKFRMDESTVAQCQVGKPDLLAASGWKA